MTAPKTIPLENDVSTPSSPARATAACGTRSGLRRHQRNAEPPCEDCRAAHRAYENARTRWGWQAQVDARWADADPVRAHVETLQAAGMGLRRIAEKSGVSRTNLHALFHGKRGNLPPARISAANAAALLALTPDPADHALLDATGTVRRIQALVAIGWPISHVGHRIGVSASNMSTLLGATQVTAARARTVATVYEALSATPGHSTRAVNHARRLGWWPPLAWDDIDDPHEVPGYWLEDPDDVDEVIVERLAHGAHWRTEGASRPERAAAAHRMLEAGISQQRITDHLGLQFPRDVENPARAS